MKVRVKGVPHFGQEGEPYNNTKGKVYFILITHPDEWVRPQDLAGSTGLNVRSLYTLMRKWSGPSWHTLQRKKIAGFYCYHLTVKGEEWFSRWHELMPLRRWRTEINQWKTEGSGNPVGTWYQDEVGHWRFRCNT